MPLLLFGGNVKRKKTKSGYYKPNYKISYITFMDFFRNSKPVPAFTEEEVDLILVHRNGHILNVDTKHILKPYAKDKSGHMIVKLKVGNNFKNFAVHQLVASAWLPNPYGKQYIHHINGCPYDNRVDNLVWVTATEHIHLHQLMHEGKENEYLEEIEKLRKDSLNADIS